MAIKLESNYSKKLGLPGYSSHQFSVSLTTELQDMSQVEAETQNIYRLLQQSVDAQIQQVGFLPNGNGAPTPKPRTTQQSPAPSNDQWNCSPKQQSFIEKIMKENNLDWNNLNELTLERFNTNLNQINKLQASGLIDELLEQYSKKKTSNNRNSYVNGRSQ